MWPPLTCAWCMRSRVAGAWQLLQHTCAWCVAALTLAARAGACWIKCWMPAPHGYQAQRACEFVRRCRCREKRASLGHLGPPQRGSNERLRSCAHRACMRIFISTCSYLQKYCAGMNATGPCVEGSMLQAKCPSTCRRDSCRQEVGARGARLTQCEIRTRWHGELVE